MFDHHFPLLMARLWHAGGVGRRAVPKIHSRAGGVVRGHWIGRRISGIRSGFCEPAEHHGEVGNLSESLVPYLRILRSAFPEPPTGEERRAVLAALFDDMSEEALGALGAALLEDEEVVVLNEAIEATTRRKVDGTLVAAARERLTEAGWDFDDEH